MTHRVRVVVTAARDGFIGLSRALRDAGYVVIESPLIGFHPPEDWTAFDCALASIERFQAVALTSPRAAAALVARLPVKPCSVPAWAAGAASARPLAGAFRTIHLPEDEDSAHGAAEALGDAMIRAEVGSPVLFPCGTLRRDTLIDRLEVAGIHAESVICYATVLASAAEARQACADADVVVVTSPSVARLVAAACDPASRPALLAVGPTTAAAATAAGWPPVAVATRPTPSSMRDAILSLDRR
jgi:uroporphyrinogen-III synthase